MNPPEIQEIGDMLRVNFYRPSYKKSAENDPVNCSVNEQIGDKSAINVPEMSPNVPEMSPNVPLTERKKEIMNILQKNPAETAKNIAAVLKVTEKTIKRDIAELKAEKLLVREGGKNGGYWKVIK